MLCVLSAMTVITIDSAGGHDSPVAPLRAAASEVFGPVQTAAAAAVRPVAGAVDLVDDARGLHEENIRLQHENALLRAELATGALDRNRLAEYDGLSGVAEGSGFELVPARVAAIGPAQAFARTVTIDAGTAEGVHADLTVVDASGLVGRVLRAGEHTATVLLAVDAGSVVGARLARSMELGFLRGNGSLGSEGRLTLDLVDPDAIPTVGDTVVTWGSQGGSPYVAGVPVGEVTGVRASAGDQSVTADVRPFADMSALDLVGVVVGPQRSGPRAVLGRTAPQPGGVR